jgi:hypothetical protein
MKKMHQMNRIHISVIALLIVFPLFSRAQDTSSIYNSTQEIVRAYIPKITDVIKLDVIPVNERTAVSKPDIKYWVKSTQFPVEREEIEKLPALKFRGKRKSKLDHYYLKGGFGNYNNILVEGVFNTTKLRDRSLSIHALHHSGKSDIKYSNAAEQLLEVNGHKDFRKSSFAGGMYLSNNRYHHYGFSALDSVDFDTLQALQIRQNFLDAGLNLSLSNELYKRSKIKYWVHLDAYNFNDYNRLNETGISVSGKIEQYFKESPIRFEAIVKQYFISSSPSLSRTLFDINARYLFIRDNFLAEVGFDAPTEIDTIESKTHFYPIAKIEGRLASNFLYGYAGITGGLLENTYQSIAGDNPFVSDNFTLKNTNKRFEFFAGFKGSVNEKFRYNTSFSYFNVENMLMFVNDSVHSERFLTYYDTSASNVTKYHAEIELNVIKNLQLFAGVNYYNWTKKGVKFTPYHTPNVDFKLSLKYNLQEKVYFNIDYFLIGERTTPNWDSISITQPTITLKAINDINLGITYKFSQKFALFFQFNNILNNKYSYWNNYNLRGFHFMAGAKLNL